MRQNIKNSSNNAKVYYGQLAAEKKKTLTALCLIVVMAFMWFRVLTKESPEAAEAKFMTEQMNADEQSNPEPKISFIELPKVAGRNDVIARDFFDSGDWRQFVSGKGQNLTGIEEVNIVSRDGSEEVIRKVAEKLKLEAIVFSKNPRAFINNKVMSVGDKLLVGDVGNKYECEVVEINENTVVIECKKATITLKLMQISIIDN